MKKLPGFTIIELIVVVGLVTLTLSLSSGWYGRYVNQNGVNNTSDRIIETLRKAQTYAVAGKQNSNWGVSFSGGDLVLYKGASYAAGTVVETLPVEGNVSVSGLGDINFLRMTGLPIVVVAGSTPTPTPAISPTPTSTTPTPTATPGPSPTPTSIPGDEWSQLAHDAQRTSYAPVLPPEPWKFAWQWNGSNGTGGLATPHVMTPRLVQPITGGGRVYIPYGSGITARLETDGSAVWDVTPGGNMVSTAAYDVDTAAVFIGSSNGNLYKLNAATGATAGSFPTAGSITTAPLLVGNYVYISSGNYVYKINKTTMAQVWQYDAGAPIQQAPSYSPSRDALVVGTSSVDLQKLNVVAINNSNGSQKWRVDPNPVLNYDPVGIDLGRPGEYAEVIEWANGWPVIAEQHGLVLMQLRSFWYYEIDGGYRFPTNAQYRTALTNNPDHRKLYALSLDDGSQPFLTVVQNSGFNNSNYGPMGPQPVVKVWPNGDEVAYTITYNSTANGPCTDPVNRQCGAAFAELLLDNTTVPGYQAGDVRLIESWMGTATLQTDEHGPVSVAGDMFFYSLWAWITGYHITDRNDSLGMPYSNAIKAGKNWPGGMDPDMVFLEENNDAGTCAFSVTHYCASHVGIEGGAREFPNGGFYIFRTTNKIYDQYWTQGVFMTVSNNRLYFRANDGAVMVLEPEGGSPTATPTPSGSSPTPTPTPSVTPTPTQIPMSGDVIITVSGNGSSRIITINSQGVVSK